MKMNMSQMLKLTLHLPPPRLDCSCGKTTICQLFAALAGHRFFSVNCHLHMETSDFLGGLRPVRHSHQVAACSSSVLVSPQECAAHLVFVMIFFSAGRWRGWETLPVARRPPGAGNEGGRRVSHGRDLPGRRLGAGKTQQVGVVELHCDQTHCGWARLHHLRLS